ncbi:MAG TPA: hypothetical protein VJ063_16255 [Verrucomicrobiae bacterium]|nr:hypothetical protein [Verrucomicrobiae bacterium]
MKKLWIAIAVALLLVAAVIVFRSQPVRQPSATLPDGTQIIVQAATYGTNHAFIHGSRILAKLQPFVPKVIGRRLPKPYIENCPTIQEELIVWYSAYQPATGKYVPVSVDEMQVIDEHGCTFQVSQFGGGQSSPTFSVGKAYIRVFPRWQRNFKLRAKFANHAGVIELQVPNPLPPRTLQWTPESLPATRITNNVVVTLTRLRAGPNFYQTSVDYDIYEDGVRRNQWYSLSRMFADATGNSSGFSLCRFERAWKVELDLYKNARAPFVESAIWRLPNIIVPRAGGVQLLTNEVRTGRLSLKLIALCGPGAFMFSNQVCFSSAPLQQGEPEQFNATSTGREVQLRFASSMPSLIMRVDGWRVSEELLVRAKSADGTAKSFSFRGSADNVCRFGMEEAAAGEVFDLEFIPQQPVHVEFMVQPPHP